MKGGGSNPVQQINTHTKSVTDTPPGSKTVKQPTAEQLRYAQLLSSGDDQCKFQERIKQVADVTSKAHDIVSVALHDSNYDTEMAIMSLLEGKYDDQENVWTTASSRKKKHQGTMQQGLDSITTTQVIPTDNNTKTTTSKPPGRAQGNRNQNKGRQQNDGGFSIENQTHTHNGLSTNESGGKGRGFRNDERWQPRTDRGPGNRGRGRPRRGASGRGRAERFGGSRNRENSGSRPGGNFSNKNTDSFNGTAQVNDITGSELWGKTESQQPTVGGWGEALPSSEDWGSEDVEVDTSNSATVSEQENSFTENNRVPPTSDSWSDRVDSWEPAISQKNEPVTFPEQEHPPYSLESLDKAVIHSKLAKTSYSKSDQPDSASSQLPSMAHLPMPSSIGDKVNGQHSKLLLSQITAMANNHAQPQPPRQPKGPRSKRPPRSQIPVQAVEMPGQSNVDALDVQFGNLEFGGDPLSSPRFSEESKSTPSTTSESTPTTTQNMNSVESVAPVSTPNSLSTSSAVTSLEQQTSMNYQSHPISREIPQSTKIPTPIPLPNQMDTRDAKPGSITIHKSVDNNKERTGTAPAMSIPPSSTISTSIGQSSRTQHSTLPTQLMNKPVTHPSLSTQPTQHSLPPQLKAQTHHTSSLSTHPTPHIGLPSQLTSQGVTLAQLAQQSSIPAQLQQPSAHMSSISPQLASQLSSQLSSSVTNNSSLDQRVHQPAHGVQSSLGGTDHSSSQNHNTSSVTKPGLAATTNMANIPAPPPGVNISMTSAYNTVNSLQGSVTTASSARPQLHTNKPNFPQGVVPLNMFNMQPPGMIPYAATLPPYGFDENMQMLQRMPLQSPYYDMPQFQTTGRDGLPTNYPGGDTKFGRNDTSSPVPSTISQGGHQQAFMNTLPQFGYGNLAFYTGGVLPSGFPAYTGPQLYQQMPVTTHGGGSKFQHNYIAQPGSQGYSASGYDDLATTQEFSKSPYHTHTSNNQGQSKTNTGSMNSGNTGTTDLTGTNTFKTQYDSKNYLCGTPPPAMNLTNQVGQVGPLNNYHHPAAAMHYMAPQQHPSLYHQPHQPHHMHQHMDSSQGSSVRSQTSGNQKTGLNKPHQNAPAQYQQTGFWSGNH